jgi:SPP1 family predicted phage head-tail adaptor
MHEIRLTRRFVLETRQVTADGAGGAVVSWQSVGLLWAHVTTRTAREDFIAGQGRPRVWFRIFVRAAPPGAASRPRPEQRLREGDRIFNILTVAEHDLFGRYLEIVAEEGVLP